MHMTYRIDRNENWEMAFLVADTENIWKTLRYASGTVTFEFVLNYRQMYKQIRSEFERFRARNGVLHARTTAVRTL